MRNYLLIICLLLFYNTAYLQEGYLTTEILQGLSEKFTLDENSKALMNAVSSNDIRALAKDRQNMYESDKHFTHRIETSGITDQKSTGRCWLFTGLNMIRAQIMHKHNLEDFHLSHNFNFFYDQLEKANLFLENIITTADKPMENKEVEWLIKHPIGDGGQWTGVVDIVSKYGIVPAEVFPESHNSENTSLMSRLLRRKLKEDALIIRKQFSEGKKDKELSKLKITMLEDIYRILAITLGEPPKEFTWRYKDKNGELSALINYTPQSFFNDFADMRFDDYIMFMNDPSREFDKLYEIKLDRHVYEGGNWKYINLETDKIKEFAVKSIIGDEPMYFSCDVGKQIDRDRGVLDIQNFDYESLFDVEFGMDKRERIITFESGSSHGMALIGVDLDQQNKPNKWLLENSWGSTGQEGNLIMTDEWFDEYMFRLVIHKQFIDEETLKILKLEPIFLPPWDPMFQPDD